MFHLVLVGLLSILAQVVLLRELSVASFGIELIYSLALGIWLLCTAFGSAINRRRLDVPPTRMMLLFLALAAAVPLEIGLARSCRIWLGGIPGAFLPFPSQCLALILVLLPSGLILGWLFQLAAKSYISRGGSLAMAYAIESAGGLVGGILATVFLKWGIANFTVGLICTGFALTPAGLATPGPKAKTIRIAAALMAIAALCASWESHPIDAWLTSWTHPDLRETGDSPYGRITIDESGGMISVFENDSLLFTSEGTEAEELVHLAALQHSKPDRVLILSGGLEGTLEEALKHSPRRIDYVELNPVLIQKAKPFLSPGARASLEAPVVRQYLRDPRQFLLDANEYDLILAGLPEPVSGQNNRFYTVEFFRLCAQRLAPEGILAFRLRSSENIWTPAMQMRMTSVSAALQSVFHRVIVLPGAANLFLAGNRNLDTSPDALAARFKERRLTARLISPAYIKYLYTNDRFAQIADSMKRAGVPANTDSLPVCFRYTLELWLSRLVPSLFRGEGMPPWGFKTWPWLLVGSGILLVVFGRRRAVLARSITAGGAGLAGMIFETVLILQYQIRYGVLFQDLGFLLTSFMAGLAAGAIASERWITASGLDARRLKWATVGISTAVAADGVVLAVLIHHGVAAGLPATMALLALAGILVAALFTLTVHLGPSDQRKETAMLYASDLAGGSLGSLAASLIFIPLFGMEVTALSVAIPAILSILLMIPGRGLSHPDPP